MHDEVYAYVATAVGEHGPFERVVEFGSLDINGTVRSLFTADYVGVDLQEGPGVDVVADATTWEPDRPVDCVVCCEVFEHTPGWPLLIESAHRALHPGGTLIVTAAGPGRGPHSAVDGNEVRPGEHYANIEPDALADALADAGFVDVSVEQLGLDVRATARSGPPPRRPVNIRPDST